MFRPVFLARTICEDDFADNTIIYSITVKGCRFYVPLFKVPLKDHTKRGRKIIKKQLQYALEKYNV